MKVRTAVGIMLLTLVTLGGATTAAQAAQYPPTVGAGRVSKSELKQCQCTQFSGEGFVPGTPVTIVDRGPDNVERVVTTVTADNKGGFKVKVCFDETSAEGQHTLIARGTDDAGAHEDRATVTVSGTVCHGKNDEVHPQSGTTNDVDTPQDSAEQPRTSTDEGADVGGVRLPRTGAAVVLPGLLVGFALVVIGTGAVQVTRRRRMVTG